jgi:hypothetical protein
MSATRGRDEIRIRGRWADQGPGGLTAVVAERLKGLVMDDAQTIFDDARESLPVRTGRSRDGLFLRDDSAGTMIVMRIGNTVDYARFSQSGKRGTTPTRGVRSVLTRDLGDPVRAARRTLATRAAAAAAQALDGEG